MQIDNLLEIRKRLRDAGINPDDYYILFNNTLNGTPIESYCITHDNKFACVILPNTNIDIENNICIFEIKEIYTTYLSNGTMSFLTKVYLCYNNN